MLPPKHVWLTHHSLVTFSIRPSGCPYLRLGWRCDICNWRLCCTRHRSNLALKATRSLRNQALSHGCRGNEGSRFTSCSSLFGSTATPLSCAVIAGEADCVGAFYLFLFGVSRLPTWNTSGVRERRIACIVSRKARLPVP